MRVGELFCGIGGFGLAAERVWGKGSVLWANDNDRFASEWYRRLFPHVRHIEQNVQILRGADLEEVDLICGGFPCQDLSSANPNGKGLAGERSGLWREFARLVRECRPRWVVVENVGRLLTFGKSGSYRVVTGDLRVAGYRVARPVLMSAGALGAPHGRTRLWIVANRDEPGLEGRGAEHELPTSDGSLHFVRVGKGLGNTTSEGLPNRRGSARTTSECDTEPERRSGFGVWDGWRPVQGHDGKVRLVPQGRIEPGLCLEVDGLPSGLVPDWREHPEAVAAGWPVAQGVPNRTGMLRGAGNAIVPAAAEVIFRAIDASERGEA